MGELGAVWRPRFEAAVAEAEAELEVDKSTAPDTRRGHAAVSNGPALFGDLQERLCLLSSTRCLRTGETGGNEI